MYTFIIILSVIISILLIGIVLIQKSKGGGLSSQFGNASAMMGVRQTNTFLEKGTWWLAAILVVLSIVSAYTIPTASGEKIRTEQQQAQNAGENQYGTDAAPIEVQLPADDAAAPAAPATPETGK